MTDYEKSVMRNIIYAVETGGQVYGNKDYADFTEAYTNSSNEKAITIGAGQWYATEAKKLLNMIRQKDSDLFTRYDKAGIAKDLDSLDWSTYRVSKSSEKAKCIVKIIDSEIGHLCQDLLVDQQMETYIQEATKLGVTNMDAKMMCANFRHQGGYGAVTRILAKTVTPYTLEHLYTACKTDTGNQVGAYKNRQKMVYESLKKYISNLKVDSESAVEAAIRVAQNEVGYLEKISNSNLDSKTGNAGDGNYTKYWRDIKPEWQGSPWCACFITWIFVRAFGRQNAEKLLKHYPYVYVPTLAGLFTRNANPKIGDIVMFWNGREFSHTGLVTDVQGDLFTTIEGNTSPNTGIEDNGDGVYQKRYYNSRMNGTKFARPDYSIITNINSGGDGETPYPSDSWKTIATAICTGNQVNVRITPGGEVIGSLNKGDLMEVDGIKYEDWVHVKASNIGIGYMHKNYVSYQDESSINDSWKSVGTAVCTGNGVYVRATPGGTIKGALLKGNRFEVDGTKSGKWVRIKVASIGIGYMSEDYIQYDNNNISNVSIAQAELNKRFNYGLVVDGDWGAKSKEAFVMAIQSTLNKVYGENLLVDGDFGANTETACAKHALKEGANNLYVGVLQIGLYSSGMSLKNGIDCDFGESTKQGVLQFQQSKGLEKDGIAGANTFKALSRSSYSAGNYWSKVDVATCTGNGVYVRLNPNGSVIGTLYKGQIFEVDGTCVGVWVHVRVANIGIGYVHQNYVALGDKTRISLIKEAQTALNKWFDLKLDVDGDWGIKSKKAFIRAIQSAINKVYGENLLVDGDFGANTETACVKYALKEGTNNLYVGVLQVGLYSQGIALSNGIDCDFGISTKNGVMAFQSKNGLSSDGVAGRDTMKKLAN